MKPQNPMSINFFFASPSKTYKNLVRNLWKPCTGIWFSIRSLKFTPKDSCPRNLIHERSLSSDFLLPPDPSRGVFRLTVSVWRSSVWRSPSDDPKPSPLNANPRKYKGGTWPVVSPVLYEIPGLVLSPGAGWVFQVFLNLCHDCLHQIFPHGEWVWRQFNLVAHFFENHSPWPKMCGVDEVHIIHSRGVAVFNYIGKIPLAFIVKLQHK